MPRRWRLPRGGGARVGAPRPTTSRRDDLEHLEREIMSYLRLRTRELSLEMRPLKVRLPLTGRKAVVYFTAEQRVDFRPLLRELGRRYRRRVEMRPLGVRDGAKLTGGLGPCGRCLCCATFMDRFHSVTVRMAKRQNLTLNPTKISGMCGRLMCCLVYEYETYMQLKKDLPKIGTIVQTPNGPGKVIRHNVTCNRLGVRLEDGMELEVPVETAQQMK
jgi:cell fate regulator YaaT (PSP1 superfamily)